MSWLGDTLKGVAGNVLGGIFGGAVNSAYAQQNAQYNMELQKELWKYMQSNKHQLEVQDLEAAGLNKILSATNGQALGAPSVSGSADTSNDVNSAAAAYKQLEIAKINAETDKVNAQANADNAATNRMKAEQDIEESKYRIPWYQGQSAKLEAEKEAIRQGIKNDLLRLQHEIKEIDSRINLNNTQSWNIAELTPYQKNKLNMEAQKLLASMGIDEKQARLLQRELEDLEPEMRRNYLENVFGEKLHYFGFAAEDISKLISGLNFTIGRYKRSD